MIRISRPSVRPAAFVAAILLFSSLAAAQTGTAPTVDELLTLQRAGLSIDELTGVIDKSAEPLFAAEDFDRLEKAQFPAILVARLRNAATKASAKTVTFDEIKTLLAAGVGDEALVAVVKQAGTLAISSDQLLELVRAGASPSVIRAVRSKTGSAPTTRPTAKPAPPSLDDLPRLTERGYASEAIVRKIEESDAHYDVDAVKLVELSRAGVPKDVIKAVWSRRKLPEPPKETPAGANSSNTEKAADVASSRPTPPRPAALAFFDDAPSGYALLKPDGFREQRDAKNGNTLTSFISGDPAQPDGLAEAELAVFTYRSTTPERLTEPNLGPVGENFLARLTASYAARKITVSFGLRENRRLAGRPAIRTRLAASGVDGATHTGEIWWLFVGDRTFVLSTAVRSDRTPDFADLLAKCVRSFTPSEKKLRPTGGDDAQKRATTAAEAWRTAVLNRDFALYESLFKTPGRDKDRLDAFTSLCDRFDDPEKRLVIGPVDVAKDGATSEFRWLGGASPVITAVRWQKDGEGYAID